VSRTANADRPDELIDRIVPYLTVHGIAGLSLRPLAKAIGSSPRVLLYYFGSSEKMIDRVLARLRDRHVEILEVDGTDPTRVAPDDGGHVSPGPCQVIGSASAGA